MVECRSWCLCANFMSAFFSNMKILFSKPLTWDCFGHLDSIQTYLVELNKWLNVGLDVRTTLE